MWRKDRENLKTDVKWGTRIKEEERTKSKRWYNNKYKQTITVSGKAKMNKRYRTSYKREVATKNEESF